MAIVAIVGLGCGSLLAAQAGPSKNKAQATPKPSPAKVIQSPAQPQIISLTPSPSPSIKTTPTAAAKVTAKTSNARKDFNWAVTIMAFPFTHDNDKFLPEQFRLANELGVKTVRIEYAINNVAANRQAIDLAHQYNMQLVFIIPFGPNDIFSDANLTANTTKYISDIVSRHKGQVQVWQLATEPASVAITEGKWGVATTDYDNAKYQAVSTWLKTATQAVKQADPSARRLINDQWIHVGFFERYIKDGGDYDIMGWNWFSDMGTDWNNPVIDPKTGQKYALLNKLKSFKRDIWLTEVNRRGGSNDGNTKAQGDYIQTMAEKAYAEPAIKSFSVFNLVEDQQAPPREKGYGITIGDPDKAWISGLKDAYNRYKNLIQAKK